MKTDINWKQDKKYFVEAGDPGFSPERNKFVVEDSIRKYEANVKAKMKQFEEMLGERTDAMATFLNNDKAILGGRGIAKYLGARNLAYLRAQDITNQLSMVSKPIFTQQQIVKVAPTLTDFHGRSRA